MARSKITLKPDGERQKVEAQKIRSRWLRELDSGKAHESKWLTRAENVIKRYRDERDDTDDGDSKFNILYANTEILKGSTYAKPPVPIVRRRYDGQNPAGVIAAKILERAIAYNNECVDLDDTLKQCVEDMYLPGRGMARVKYRPTMVEDTRRVEVLEEDAFDTSKKPPVLREGVEQDDKGFFKTDTFERVVYEKAPVDHVDYRFFRYSPAPTWKQVRWVAFGDLLTRDDCIRQFGKTVGRKIKLTWKPEKPDGAEPSQTDARALVWVVWNKPDSAVYTVSEGYEDGPLAVTPDPLKLEGFFPCPEPLYDIKTNGSLVPIPNFCTYQDQADELDELTNRITKLAAAMKRRGVYDGTVASELSQLADAGDNQFIPIQNLTALREKGGLEQVFMAEPIAQTAQVLTGLYLEREQCKAVIYEITGISDIVRGNSKASETLGAQELKSQYASLRVKQRQQAVQRFALHLMRLQGEIISEHFSQETLAAMTGVKLPTNAEKQAATAQVQAAAAQGQQVPPPPILQMPSWEDVMALLRDDHMRGFSLEIETDSTIALNEADEQESVVKMVNAMGQMGSQLAPAVQQGFISPGAAKAIAKFAARKFRASREVEDELDAEVQQPPGPDPAELQKQVEEIQQAQQQVQEATQALQQEKAALDLQQTQFKHEVANQKMVDELSEQQAGLEHQARMAEIEKAIDQLKLMEQKLAQASDLAVQKVDSKMEMVKERAQAAGETEDGQSAKPSAVETLAATNAEVLATLQALVENLSRPKTVTLPSGKTATIETAQ
jgi:hypothetical protein